MARVANFPTAGSNADPNAARNLFPLFPVAKVGDESVTLASNVLVLGRALFWVGYLITEAGEDCARHDTTHP